MWKNAKGFVLLVLMVAVPLIAQVLGHKTVRDFQWTYTYTYAILAVAVVSAFIYLKLKTDPISGYLDLAEADMNNLLRAWGGGPPAATARQDIAKERGKWADILPADSKKREDLFDLLKTDYEGGPSGKAMGNARATAFLLRELYKGRVNTAQAKVFAETQINDGKIPYVAPGIRELIGFNKFDKNNGFPKDAGVDSSLLFLTVKLNQYPRNIKMVRADTSGNKMVVTNRDVIEELTKPRI